MIAKASLIVSVFCAIVAFVATQDCGQLNNTNIDDKTSNLPWTVKIRERATNDVLCMGTLISNRHVLIAAHCLWPKPYYKTLKVISNIYASIDFEALDFMEVRIHEDWKFNSQKFDADIAVLTLFNPVDLPHVQPICLPPPNSGNLLRNGGVIAGISGIDHSNIRHRANLEKNDICFRKFPNSFVSPRTFCASWPSEDLELSSGSSSAHYYSVDSTWFVQGVESDSFVQKVECDISKHSVFSNVGHYVDWIQKIVKRDTQQTWKDIELKCTYARNLDGLYGCEVENLIINSPSVRVASISGQHQDNHGNSDVEYVWIRNSRAPYLPRFDAGIFFPNMLKYVVTNSAVKFVSRDDFSGMPKLETLNLENNEIEEISEDTLYDLDELVDLFIENNKLKALPANLLSNAHMFQRLKASNNSIEVLDVSFFKSNHALKIVSLDNNRLNKIFVDFRPFKNLKKVDLLNNDCISTNFNDWRKYKTVPIVQKEIERTCQ